MKMERKLTLLLILTLLGIVHFFDGTKWHENVFDGESVKSGLQLHSFSMTAGPVWESVEMCRLWAWLISLHGIFHSFHVFEHMLWVG